MKKLFKGLLIAVMAIAQSPDEILVNFVAMGA